MRHGILFVAKVMFKLEKANGREEVTIEEDH